MSAPRQGIIHRLRAQDPLLLVGAASLLVLVILAAITLPLFLRTIQQRKNMEANLSSLQETIVQARRTQAAQPAMLQQQIAETQGQIQTLLADWPTTEQASQELTRYYQHADELGVQLTRMEALPGDPAPETAPVYRMDRFLIEARGELPDLLRFMEHIGSHSYTTFVLDKLTIQPDGPSVAQAELLLFASDLSAGAEPPIIPSLAPTPAPSATALTADQQSELLHLQVLIQQKALQENWAAVIEHGERLLGLSPQQKNARELVYQAHIQLAEDLVRRGEHTEARAHYEAALRLVPDGEQALLGLASMDTADAATPTPQPDTLIYTVRRGDSLSAIASRYNISVQDLMVANNMRNTTIYVGQQLVIPLR
ncbi:MAG: LysM peptidoglycan-binding domain-containing protein [Chloroflexi bacterium]|nr:LysM peptidoglycan-binding domain-containing protein [Chloroflexota bacterium]